MDEIIQVVWEFIKEYNPLFTIVGLIIAINQINKVKNSSLASQTAVINTISQLSQRSTISDIAVIQGSLRESQLSLRAENYDATLFRLQSIRLKLSELKNRRGFTSSEKLENIQGIIFLIRRMQDLIERKFQDNSLDISIPQINQELDDIMNVLAEWSEELQYEPGASNG